MKQRKGLTTDKENLGLSYGGPFPCCELDMPTMSIYYKNSEYVKEIPQSQTADKPMAQHNKYETPWRQTKQSSQLSLPQRDDCKTRMDT